jgi:hypothetical protein
MRDTRCEIGVGTEPGYRGRRLTAAEAWALAGEQAHALGQLELLAARGWPGPPDRLTSSWALQGLRELPEFRALVARIQARAQPGPAE